MRSIRRKTDQKQLGSTKSYCQRRSALRSSGSHSFQVDIRYKVVRHGHCRLSKIPPHGWQRVNHGVVIKVHDVREEGARYAAAEAGFFYGGRFTRHGGVLRDQKGSCEWMIQQQQQQQQHLEVEHNVPPSTGDEHRLSGALDPLQWPIGLWNVRVHVQEPPERRGLVNVDVS